jgi:hypothetical protein
MGAEREYADSAAGGKGHGQIDELWDFHNRATEPKAVQTGHWMEDLSAGSVPA